MTVFAYRDGHYCVEDVPLRRIADDCGTPFYCYSRAAIEAAYDAYQAALKDCDALICYAIKANSNQAVIALLAARGAGADVVSEGELRRALAAGIPASKIGITLLLNEITAKTLNCLLVGIDDAIIISHHIDKILHGIK